MSETTSEEKHTIQDLLNLIIEINKYPNLKQYSTEAYKKPIINANKINDTKLFNQLMELDLMANDLLITKLGQACYLAIRQLEELAASEQFVVSVYAGEKDSFGWLTGVIEAPNFKYVFG